MSIPTDPPDDSSRDRDASADAQSKPTQKRIQTNRHRPGPEVQRRPPKAPGTVTSSEPWNRSEARAKRDAKNRPDRSDARGPKREGPGSEERGERRPKEMPKGGAQRGKGWSPANPDEPPPSRVGGARNEHGTRVARRVVCTRCGAHDHVQWVEQDNSTALCKVCAEELLGVLELGRREKQKTRDEICNLCGIPFAMPDHVEDDGDPLCGNCLRGFMAWQGTIDRTFKERQLEVSSSVRPGLRVRRRDPSAPVPQMGAEEEAPTSPPPQEEGANLDAAETASDDADSGRPSGVPQE